LVVAPSFFSFQKIRLVQEAIYWPHLAVLDAFFELLPYVDLD
jgi:hypothetical protein